MLLNGKCYLLLVVKNHINQTFWIAQNKSSKVQGYFAKQAKNSIYNYYHTSEVKFEDTKEVTRL